MSKHVGPPDPDETNGAAVATIAVVGVLGVVVALLAVLRPGGDDPQRVGEVAAPTTVPAVSSAPAAVQPVSPGATIRLRHPHRGAQQQEVGSGGGRLRHRAQRAAEQEPTSFRVSTFNVLGASHTSRGGNKRGWAPAGTRMSWAVTILQANDVDVTGLQEFEAPQLRTFLARTHGSWAVYPGLSAGESAVRNSIAWRTDTWQLVMGTTMPVPYFHGHDVPMPVVRLHNIASGQDVYFINVHNPASTGRWGNNEHWRDVATARELAMVSRIHATGYPVVLTGDFNERAEVFCRVVGTGVMRAAAGGTAAGGCAPPGGMGVDWIFGSAVIEFSGFTQQRTGLVQRATDHPFVVADATIPPLEQPSGDAGGTGVAGG